METVRITGVVAESKAPHRIDQATGTEVFIERGAGGGSVRVQWSPDGGLRSVELRNKETLVRKKD